MVFGAFRGEKLENRTKNTGVMSIFIEIAGGFSKRHNFGVCRSIFLVLAQNCGEFRAASFEVRNVEIGAGTRKLWRVLPAGGVF